ncbi:MAG: hypothetical protein O7H41_13365 [Planctomycetota bacterium]|nr:hypothetical protein [Planctomycetota bacterium]
MGDHQVPRIKPFVLGGELQDLEPVRDEIFLDLQDGTGTEFLAGTCYGQAVEECLRVQDSGFILKVRRDMRALLLSQLKQKYKAFRVYRLAGQPESRLVPTGDLLVRFSSEATPSQRLLAVKECFSGLGGEEETRDGTFRLTGKFASDPIVACKAIEFNPAIRQVVPLMEAIPSPSEDGVREDLLAKK